MADAFLRKLQFAIGRAVNEGYPVVVCGENEKGDVKAVYFENETLTDTEINQMDYVWCDIVKLDPAKKKIISRTRYEKKGKKMVATQGHLTWNK
ncbi:MAG: hypothetical protein J6U54_07740 [Clostridiales bacterium]|nr:hypothetical protein [Clostridiales bacterium]